MRLLFLFCAFAFILPLRTLALSDTVKVLTKDAFLGIVRSYNPLARAANLQVARAEAGIQQARGAFDPSLEGSLQRKTLDGKVYYSYLNPQISIPTWYGLELIGGIEDVWGERVNPETTIGRLSYAGAKLNISGIWMDNRRATLQQAKALREQSLAERRLALNNLLYDALGAYFNWQREAAMLDILNEALRNAEERLRFVRIEFEQGARPAIDTVEALTQLQAIQLQQSAASLANANAALELSSFLWLENGQPLPPEIQLYPARIAKAEELPPLEYLLRYAGDNHPKLLALRSKMDALDIERRLKATYLLPKMSVKATALSKDYNKTAENGMSPYLESNNKIAAELRLPLFMLEARGAYRAAGLKQRETGLELDAAMQSIQIKIRTAYNEALNLRAQLQIAEAAQQNYARLYNGERLKTATGESTMFLLNSRQNKVVEAAQKATELRAKAQKAEAALYFAAGLLE
jgi:outer membrane protein TolC